MPEEAEAGAAPQPASAFADVPLSRSSSGGDSTGSGEPEEPSFHDPAISLSTALLQLRVRLSGETCEPRIHDAQLQARHKDSGNSGEPDKVSFLDPAHLCCSRHCSGCVQTVLAANTNLQTNACARAGRPAFCTLPGHIRGEDKETFVTAA